MDELFSNRQFGIVHAVTVLINNLLIAEVFPGLSWVTNDVGTTPTQNDRVIMTYFNSLMPSDAYIRQ